MVQSPSSAYFPRASTSAQSLRPARKSTCLYPQSWTSGKHGATRLPLLAVSSPALPLPRHRTKQIVSFRNSSFSTRTGIYDYASDLTTLKDHVAGKLQRSLLVLWSAVGLILLIVSVNLSNLQLSRAAARSKEFAMRRALGASRGRIVRQLLTESLILSLSGAVVGFAIAWAIVYYLAHQNSIALPLLTTIHLDTAALSWTLVIAIAVGILFGLAPALRISGANLQEVIKDNAAGLAAGRSHERFRSVLVISELALACLLLVGAGLLLRSFLRVLDVDLGFNPSHAAAMQTDLPPATNKDQLVQRANFLKSEIDRVSALPGVQSVGIADMLPLDRNREWGLESVGRYHAKDADTGALVYLVTPGYLRGHGDAPALEGRDFSWNDTPDTAAGHHHQRSGRTPRVARRRPYWQARQRRGKQACPRHRCHRRCPRKLARTKLQPRDLRSHDAERDVEGATLIVRSRMDPEGLAGSVLATLRSLNPSQPATAFRPLRSLVDHSVSLRRFLVLLVTIFATLGALLAALGIYGVISYSVTQKTQEIGVRMALGASAGRVQRDVLAKTLRLAIVGIALGTIGSLGAARLIASLLFATSPWDPIAFAAMATSLTGIALLSGYFPARRASKIQPMDALRSN